MDTMNIALPENMKKFVREQVAKGGLQQRERIRKRIRTDEKENARATLESKIIEGLQSGDSSPMTGQDWRDIRSEVRKRHARRKKA